MRSIPSALQTHLDGDVTTTCRLLKITLTDARVFGLTTLDRDVVYLGDTYSAVNGFDASLIATDTGLSVDNAEGYALLSADIPGITTTMVQAGQLDDATWQMLLVNYADPTMGAAIIDEGDLGEVRVVDDVVYIPELLSYAMRLRQAIGHVWSRYCRAIFGTPADSQTGCGIDAEALMVAGTVTVTAGEPRRVFAAAGFTPSGGWVAPLVPGRLRWLTGPNASPRLYQIEAYDSPTDTFSLLEVVPFNIAAGHTFEARPDCDKSPATCTLYGNWLNYKGENLIPVGDGATVLTPQSQTSGGFTG